jgi:hypothetical protein
MSSFPKQAQSITKDKLCKHLADWPSPSSTRSRYCTKELARELLIRDSKAARREGQAKITESLYCVDKRSRGACVPVHSSAKVAVALRMGLMETEYREKVLRDVVV